MNLDQKLQDLLSEYEPICDPQERMSLVVDSVPKARLLPTDLRVDANRVPGCVSAAWIAGHMENGLCQFRCAADSPLVQGLLACLCNFFSNTPPDEIAATSLDPLKSLGLSKNLSPTRQNGLANARNRILSIAQNMSKNK